MRPLKTIVAGTLALLAAVPLSAQTRAAENKKPNILFIITDDHAYQTLGTGKDDSPVALPNFNKLGRQGMVFDRSYCANSLCGPSRACILTGRHSHMNGFVFNGQRPLDGSQPTYPKMLQKAGYQTGLFGKWHLESDPTGFDTWEIFPGQGSYYNPDFISLKPDGKRQTKRFPGYATDVVTDKSIQWLENRDKNKPFLLVVGHKAPHRAWCPAPRHLGKVDTSSMTPPSNFHDDYANRPEFLKKNQQTVANHMAIYSDLKVLKDQVPEEMRKDIVSPGYGWDLGELNRMTPEERKTWTDYYAKRTKSLVDGMKSGKLKDPKAFAEWKWHAYMEDYLGCLLSVDESIGRLMEYLDKEGIAKDTLVIYCGDQGFYMGEHGMYDKRWIFEESFRMPLIMRWPGHIKPGVRSSAMVQELDYAPTFCDVAGVNTKENMNTFQGRSLTPLFKTGEHQDFKNRSLYYAFYENPGEHNAPRHDGLRTDRYTLSYIWTSDEWMLFDNQKDPAQMHNVINKPEYAETVKELKTLYGKLRKDYQVPEGFPGATGKLAVKPQWDCAPSRD